MSGGYFDYLQYRFTEIVESIEEKIEHNGRLKTKEELKDDWYWPTDSEYISPEELRYYEYPADIIEEFKVGIKYIKLAQIYATRIDKLVSGDDDEDSFRERLKEDLEG